MIHGAYIAYAVIAYAAARLAQEYGFLGRPHQFAALLVILIIGLIGLAKITK